MRRSAAGGGRGWPLRAQLPSLGFILVVVLVVSSGIVAIVRHDRIETERYLREENARVASRQQVFARGHLDETLTLCRDGWREQLGFYHEPAALAWTHGSVDGYFLEGTDSASLRQVRCDVQGVSRGPRVAHPLHDVLPAEAPAEAPEEASEEDDAGWHAAIGAAPRSFAEGDLAFELLRHPVTGQALSRRWRGEENGAVATLAPADAPAFPLLVATPGFQPTPALPSLKPLPRHYWLAQPEAAFDLLAREIPAGALVSEVTLEADRIDVQLAHPTKAFDGKPPTPYGEKTFDEYGVADTSWWYPREIPGFGCASGRPLGAVRAAFAEAKARQRAALTRAWYSCSTAYSNGREGTWSVVSAE